MSRLDLTTDRIDMTHGAGGRAMQGLIERLFHAAFDDPVLLRADDAAVLPAADGPLVMSTDSFVVSPLFFPGGDIGSLAVHGTVNDLSMMGARPLYLSSAFIIEEGFALADLDRIVASMAAAARAAGVRIVTGDTKVVERGKADGLFITTAGIGVGRVGVHPAADRARAGDRILVNGPLGDHGVAVLSARGQIGLDAPVHSDSAALNGLVEAMIAVDADLHCLRDATRGGVAAVLNELCDRSHVGMTIEESALPVRPAVKGACEALGLDPLDLANEGKLVAVVDAASAQAVLAAMRAHPLGRDAALIGTVVDDPDHLVEMTTRFGGRRLIQWRAGEALPRIC
ncbi:hydrogenase expression/formation protein HypE [Rhodospirillum rubrum]|uniref:hydrogenase expression/formation protein HypE n=1 Tax=Rhodospirillum rubrum TaxID=1085 RepID=UPI001905CE60|nr:hydrogenase expression/formation protein HypE [Rhodospirillum rubrum]MBK1664838.1 hydrogenase expression/formation protein HypE [Rhodospirillum rubrum]MBK1677116.1 hydrogenase expression/formation protein HypE [Rhodospirillum rubrum]